MQVKSVSFDRPLSREEIAQRRALAEQLQAAPRQQVRHPMQAAANFAQDLSGHIQGWRADSAEKKRRQAIVDQLGGAAAPGGMSPETWNAVVQNDPDAALEYQIQSGMQQWQMQQEAARAAADRQAQQDWWMKQQEYQRQNSAVKDMTPEEIAQYGLPQGTIAQRDANGGVKIVREPTKAAGDFKVVGDQLVHIGSDGSISDVTPAGTEAPKSGFRYKGNSVEAQSLNGLMDSGELTPEQAQQLGAGKTITGPNGEIIFMTPQGVFKRPPSGDAEPVGNIQITEPKVTIDERKAATFADRMLSSGSIIDQFGAAGTGALDRLMSNVPLVGNYMVSEDFQKLDQARRDFINAQLRRESGAVISDEEFDNANKQYFPQPGDSEDVIKQKAANRQLAIKGMVRDSGPTYEQPAQPGPAPKAGARLKFNPVTGELE